SANASGAWSFATATLADGSHAFTSKAIDAAGNVSTASAALNVTIDTMAPVTPTVLSISSNSFVSGGSAILSFHAENDSAAAAGATEAKVYLSTDSTINASDTLLSVVTVDALQKGAFLSEDVTINLPTNVASGEYWIGVAIDANGQVAGGNANNTASVEVSLFNPDTSNIVQTAAVTSYHSMYNTIPSPAEIDVLTQFSQNQFSYGSRIGVIDPSIYMHQALGLALASQSDTGSKYWSNLNSPIGLHSDLIPNTVAGDTYWAASAYKTVFGSTPGALQTQHFEDQVVFFKNLYQTSGAFGSDGNVIDLLARGAVYGQMIGIAVESHGFPGADLI
ncbi:MAG TPA: Ig-like domain-containing protein, partial [Sedimentisphaerales bacterium]